MTILLINKLLRHFCGYASVLIGLVFSHSVVAEQNVYFGTGSKQGDGIYLAKLDESTGNLSEAKRVAEITAPGFLAKHPTLNIIYAIAMKNKQAVVVAYQQSSNGELTELNYVAVGDGRSAHIAVHPSGKFLLTAQYGGGSVALFSLTANGQLNQREQLIKHQGGSGVVGNRQNSPHPHWVGFSPNGKLALVPDLGMDAAVIYKVDEDKPAIEQFAQANTIAGGGPRHMRISENGKYIYLLNELAMSVSTFLFSEGSGKTDLIRVTPTLPDGVKEQEAFNSASEILVHPSGKFVYSANRGHDSVSVFATDKTQGKLTLLENEHVRGAFPRNINMDLNGQWLLAAGQHSNTVSVFAIDQDSGLLQYQTNNTINVPEPICILFDK